MIIEDYPERIIKGFNNETYTKNQKGTLNECLIADKLLDSKYKVRVLMNDNPNYDLIISKDGKTNEIECKLDNTAHLTGNFYFEYWNYTHNRKTGINNDNLNTLYTHTYYNSDAKYYYFIYGKRKQFVRAINKVLENAPDKIRKYDHIFDTYKGIQGDAAYIVDINTFLSYFDGVPIQLHSNRYSKA